MIVATAASVVRKLEATEVAFCRALLETFAGSRIPSSIMFTYFSVYASKPIPSSDSLTLFTMTAPLRPAFSAIWLRGASRAFRTIWAPVFSWDDTLFHCRAGSVQSILHAIFCLFHLSLGGCAYTDYRYAARELGQTLLELLSVEIGLGLFDLFLDLSDAGSKSFLVAEAVNDDCIFLLNLDALGAAGAAC